MSARIPADIVSVTDYWAHAQARLTPAAWAYFSAGAGDGSGVQANEAAFERYTIMPRVLKSLQGADTQITLAGRRYAHPLFLAPVAWQGWAHPEAEVATALAAAALGSPMIVSMQTTTALERLLAAAPQGRYWFQWYWQTDDNASQALLQQCAQLGVEAIVLTVDAPVQGLRYAEQRAGQERPGNLVTPHWSAFERPTSHMAQPGQPPLFGSPLLEQAPTWTQVQQFIAQSPLPVWLKGILHPDDARLAVEIGAAGVIVSNHGGRQLAAAPAALDCLAEVVNAVQGQIPVLFDGGIRRGSDVFIALALGAQAVCIGRPYIMGLAVGGAAGVAHVLHLLRTELELTMALAGSARCADIRAQQLQRH